MNDRSRCNILGVVVSMINMSLALETIIQVKGDCHFTCAMLGAVQVRRQFLKTRLAQLPTLGLERPV